MKMKIRTLIHFTMLTAIVQFSSCGDDNEKPQTIPTVTTNSTITTTTTSATVSGEITDNGNATITEAGFVYSSIVDEPTTSDNKKEVTDFGEFTAEITGLVSGTPYKVRAYAINKKGTSYGEIRSFETGNLAPVVTNVEISGTPEVAKTLTVGYVFTDAEGDTEDVTATGTTFQWYAADNSTGLNEAAINGATAKTFVVSDAQNGKVLRVKVTPKATEGTLTGIEAFSPYSTAIGAETVTFTYNNVSVTYGTIIGPSGKKWLDRDLGATRVAQSATDYLAFGDQFQWGRLADGHQLMTRTSAAPTDAVGVKGITSTSSPYELSEGDVPTTNKFIINGDAVSTRDWRIAPNDDLWQGVSGTNNPCPSGWRIATREEWIAEGVTNGPDGFAKLKLTYGGGRRSTSSGNIGNEAFGYYWTSTRYTTADPDPANFSHRAGYVVLGEAEVDVNGNNPRATGSQCRCIKN